MTPDRKKPGVAFSATVVVVVGVIGYPLSLGPACWMAGENETALDVVPIAYYPILWLARATRPIGSFGNLDRCIKSYSIFGRSDGGWPCLARNGDRVWVVPPDR